MMDKFKQCVEDLGTIGRMLELPHGQDIAAEMLRELAPYLRELGELERRDPTGAVSLILEYAEGLRSRLGGAESAVLKTTPPLTSERVA
jgi:hypothetical protein